MFGNIIQTKKGLRLIDAGFALICDERNIESFVWVLMREQNELAYFKEYYLSL